jgi:hypothetical protein
VRERFRHSREFQAEALSKTGVDLIDGPARHPGDRSTPESRRHGGRPWRLQRAKAAASICSKKPTGFTRPARADGAVALRFVLMVEWVERQ